MRLGHFQAHSSRTLSLTFRCTLLQNLVTYFQVYTIPEPCHLLSGIHICRTLSFIFRYTQFQNLVTYFQVHIFPEPCHLLSRIHSSRTLSLTFRCPHSWEIASCRIFWTQKRNIHIVCLPVPIEQKLQPLAGPNFKPLKLNYDNERN
jgi:hypothetical protein